MSRTVCVIMVPEQRTPGTGIHCLISLKQTVCPCRVKFCLEGFLPRSDGPRSSRRRLHQTRLPYVQIIQQQNSQQEVSPKVSMTNLEDDATRKGAAPQDGQRETALPTGVKSSGRLPL